MLFKGQNIVIDAAQENDMRENRDSQLLDFFKCSCDFRIEFGRMIRMDDKENLEA
jgi:hypothetical protein